MLRLGCKLFITSRLRYICPNQWIIHLNNRVLCYKNTNINLTITRLSCSYTQLHVAQLVNDTLFNSLFQSQLWSIVTSSSSSSSSSSRFIQY